MAAAVMTAMARTDAGEFAARSDLDQGPCLNAGMSGDEKFAMLGS